MSLSELFYVGGMSAITLGFPTLLVVMMALDHLRPRAVPAKAPVPIPEVAPMRRAA